MAFRGVVFGRDGRHADDTRLPANTRAHHQGFAIFLKFHDLGEVSAQGLPRQAACLCQDFPQVVGPEGQFPKPRQSGLLSQQLHIAALLRVAQYTLSEWCRLAHSAS